MAINVNRRSFVAIVGGAVCSTILTGCGGSQTSSSAVSSNSSVSSATQGDADYKILVNNQHEIPTNWEDTIELVEYKNSEDWGGKVESKAYDAYLALKDDLANENVFIDLDSAYRSVEAQQKVWDEFLQKYGEAYTRTHVAKPHHSEHHTGLALDVFLIIDNKGVYENEDMLKHPDIWKKIHAKLADHGFILRYLPGKKYITGYSYEPWHIRYLDDSSTAHEIMDKGLTYEEYLNDVDPLVKDCTVDYGTSETFIEKDMDYALDAILTEFATWKGCTLKRIAYAGDKASADDLIYVNDLRKDKLPEHPEFDQSIVFVTDFHSPSAENAEGTAWEPDKDYNDYTWHLGRTGEDGTWELMSWGYA